MDRAGFFETIVGLIVVAVAAGFMVYAYGISGTKVGGGQYQLDAVFGRVDGVAVGADVRIAGVNVGVVTDQQLNTQTYEADLSLLINNGVPIPEDSIAKIASDGLLGGSYVAIEPGASEDYLVNGDKITITRGAVDFLSLAVQAFTAPQGQAQAAPGPSELEPLGDF